MTDFKNKPHTDTLPTLLRAAANGARLQLDYGYLEPDRWKTMDSIMPAIDSNLHHWRIHPEDYPLRYSKISRFYYEISKTLKFNTEPVVPYRISGIRVMTDVGDRPIDYPRTSKLAKSLYFLFVAEELMLEGL
jgi:hypothetical protein